MDLRKKTLLAVGLAVGCTLLAISFTTYLFIEHSQRAMENEQADRALEHASYAIRSDGEVLVANLRDYAAWNDTYAFMNGQDPTYLEINLRKEIFSLYSIDAVVFLSRDNRYLAGGQVDPVSGSAGPVDSTIIAALEDLSTRQNLIGRDQGSMQIVNLPPGPALVASHPVLTDFFTGPPAGTMHFVRLITPQSMDRISRLIGHNTEIRSENDLAGDPVTAPLLPLSSGQTANVIAPDGSHTIGVMRLETTGDTAPMYITVTDPRDLYQRATSMVLMFVVLLMMGGVVMTAGIVIFVDRIAFSRLNTIIASLQKRRDALPESGGRELDDGDELASLAALIDPMVQDLVDSHNRLRAGEASYKGLFNTIRQAIFILDDKGKIIDVNDGAVAMYGYSREEAIGKTWEFLTPSGVNGITAIADKIHRALAGEPQEFGFFGLRKNGEIFPLDVWLYKSTYYGNDVLLAIIADITQRREAERELADSEERFRTLMDSIPGVSIQGYTADGIVRYWNQASETVYGYTAEEALGRNLADLIIPENLQSLFSQSLVMAKATTHSGAFMPPGELLLRRKDGLPAPVYSIHTAVISEGKEPLFFCIDFDLSERKKAEQALAMANRKLNLMFSITRHDILNQILVLQGYITLLKEAASDEERAQRLDKLDQTADAIARQITFTRDYQDIGVRAPAWHNVERIAREAASHLLPPEIFLTITTGTLEIFTDPLIVKVFYNLIDNTLQHGGKARSIRIHAEKTDGGITIVYEDDGVGIVPEAKDKIFTKGYGSHTGLGLFLTTQILAITGITIRENGEPGKGGRFEMLVPDGMHRNGPGGS